MVYSNRSAIMSKRALILLFTGVVVTLISIDDTNASPSLESVLKFMGVKLSVTSKSDIRYEGTLYAMDVREATISLAKVRSFGTEDRPTDQFVPSRDELYEFIIFKGSDIKAIDALEPPNREGLEGSEGVEGEEGLIDGITYHVIKNEQF